MENNDAWLGQIVEDVVDPDREIVDPHFHIWPPEGLYYDLDQYVADASSGHNVVQAVYVDCGVCYREDGPDYLKFAGETEHAARAASITAQNPDSVSIAGTVGRIDLLDDHVAELLDAHEEAGQGYFRGVRHNGAWDPHREFLEIKGIADQGLYLDEKARRSAALIGKRGLTLDSFMFHHQIGEYTEMAKAVSDTVLVFDHIGMPIGVGPYEGHRDDIFAKWKADITELGKCENVYAKMAGLVMPDMGWGFRERDLPPTSDEIVEAHGEWYEHVIESFGPSRCMFESNFPVDRQAVSYRTQWNAYKKIAAKYSDDEQDLMFSEVARKVYRL